MPYYENNPKVLRLNEVFNELNYRSYNAFAVDVGSSQPAVANYVKGKRVPTAEFLLLVLKRFPQYNQQWLIDGEGEKYNKEYVDINMNGHNFISGNKNTGDCIIGNNNKIDEEVKQLYDQLVDSLKSQIKTLEQQVYLLKRDNEMLHKALKERMDSKE